MNMRSYKVYAHINKINGKVYIGITGMSVSKRWQNGKGYQLQTIIGKAIHKYGWDNFHHIILEDGLTKSEACKIEIELISYYKGLGISYNNSNGGEINRGYKWDEESKLKISGNNNYWFGKDRSGNNSPNYGKPLSDETKKKISKSLSGSNNYNYGKPLSDETKKKISELNKGKHSKWDNGKYHKGLLVMIDDNKKIFTVNELSKEYHMERTYIRKRLKDNNKVSIRCKETNEIHIIKKVG